MSPTLPTSESIPSVNESFLLGVDGGGTKTVALLAEVSASGDFHVIGRGKAASSNINAVGWDGAVASLELAVEEAWRTAGKDPLSASFAVLALAGAGQAAMKVRFSDWASQRGIAKGVKVIHDAEAVLRAGSPEAWGVALIAGTGSVAFGLDKNQKPSVSGGWGFWFGDEGSAFWLGQSALRAASMATDGRGPCTSLTEAIMKRLGIDEPRRILHTLSVDANVRHNIASLADVVVAEAARGDDVAQQIVTSGAVELSKLVESTATRLRLTLPFPLAMAGGVLCNSPLLKEAVEQELTRRGISPSIVEIVREPALGALNLACELSCKH